MNVFGDERAENTAQYLKEAKESFEDYAQSVRTNALNSRENIISDIFESAADILSAVIVSVTGFNATSNSLQVVAEMDTEFLNREKKFLKKMENQMNKAAEKVESTQSEVDSKFNEFQEKINELPLIFEETLKKVDERNKAMIENEQKKIDARIERAKEKQKIVIYELEVEHKRKLEQYEKEWQEKIKAIDDENEEISKSLKEEITKKQRLFHQRDEDIRNKSIEYGEKERECVKQFEEKKAAEIQNLEALKKTLEEYQNKEKEDEQNMQEIQKQNDIKLKEKKTKLERKLNEETSRVSEEYDAIMNVYMQKKQELDDIKTNLILFMQNASHTTEKRVKETKEETERLVEAAVKDVEDRLQPQLLQYTQDLQIAESLRSKSLEELRKASLVSTEEGEMEIIEINKAHQELRNKLLDVLRKEKIELQEALDERGKNIDSLKSKYNNSIKEYKAQLEKNEVEHQKKLAEIEANFKIKEAKIAEKRKKMKEETEKKLEVEKERLKDEHEQRSRAIIFKADTQLKMEIERATALGVSEANEQHKKEMKSLKEKILALQNQMNQIEKDTEKVQEKFKKELETFSIENNSAFKEKKRNVIAQNESEIKELESIRDKYMNDAAAMQKEIDELTTQSAEYASHKILTVTEYAETGDPKFVEERDKERKKLKIARERKAKLEEEIISAKAKEEYAEEQLNKATQELNDYKSKFDNEINKVVLARKRELDKMLKDEKDKVNKYNDESREEKLRLEKKLTKVMNDQAAVEEQFKEKMGVFIKEREQKLADAEKEMEKKFEEEIEEMKKQHEVEMKEMRKKLSQMKVERINNLVEINKGYNQDLKDAQAKYEEELKTISEEKADALAQIDALEGKLRMEKAKECPECKTKLEELRRLKAKREELQIQFDELTKTTSASEVKMTTLFGSTTPSNQVNVTTPVIAATTGSRMKRTTSLKSQQSAPRSATISRPTSGAKKNMVMPTPR